MKKISKVLIFASLVVVSSMAVSFGAATFAFFDKTKVLLNDSSEELRVEADQQNYRNVTFTVRAKTANANKCVYIYDEILKKSVKMSPVNADRQQYEVTYLVKVGTFRYRYFIADIDNPDSNAICENGSLAAKREITIDATTSAQTDRWICKLTLRALNKDTNNDGDVYVRGYWGTANWSDKKMTYYHDITHNWSVDVSIEQYVDSNGTAYSYKYYHGHKNGSQTWEYSGDDRNLQSTLGDYSCEAYSTFICNDTYGSR